MSVVSDTSVLSGLAIGGQLDLLRALYGQVVVPAAVMNELRRGAQDDARLIEVLSIDWLAVKACKRSQLVAELQTVYKLDRGEAEAISLALELEADALLIDERLGRREASRLGLSITGTLGVLLAAKRQNLIGEIRPVVDALISEASFRLSNQLYTEVITTAGEAVGDV